MKNKRKVTRKVLCRYLLAWIMGLLLLTTSCRGDGSRKFNRRFISAQSVSAERLWADLNALQGERYHPGDRDRTRKYLRQSLSSVGWQVEEQTFAAGMNLIATWPDSGTPVMSKRLLIGAHYDTVLGSPGADDNATGMAALLEIGRIYAGEPGLELVFFDREEQGLEGSLAFATPERIATLSGAIVLEMLGFTCQEAGCQSYPEFLQRQPESDRGEFIAVVGDAEHPELLQAFEELQSHNLQDSTKLAPVFSLAVPLKGILTPDVLRSDHTPFWLRGLGAVLVTDTANLRNPHYHKPEDRIDTLDLDFLAAVTQRVVMAIAQLQSSLSSPSPR